MDPPFRPAHAPDPGAAVSSAGLDLRGKVRRLANHGVQAGRCGPSLEPKWHRLHRRFRALAAAIASLPDVTLLLDGEVTAFDAHLLSRRAFLHPDPPAVVTPPIYIAFDCVQASGRDLREHPLGARREVLERLIADHHLLFPARRLPAHGLAAWAEVQRRGYEGLVAKDESSAYRGGRTRSWLKVKLRDEERVPVGCYRTETSDRGRPESTPLPVARPLVPPGARRLPAFDSAVFH